MLSKVPVTHTMLLLVESVCLVDLFLYRLWALAFKKANRAIRECLQEQRA